MLRFLFTLAFVAGGLAVPFASAAEVQFVIGDYLPVEEGLWMTDSSPLLRPFGVDFATDGTMFIVELEGGRIFTLRNQQLAHVSGNGSRTYLGDGQGWQSATYNGMHNCAVTSTGDVLVADTWNHCVRCIDAESRVVSTLAGTGQAGFSGDGSDAKNAQFNFVMCVTLSPDGSTLHVADLRNRRIRAIDLATNVVSTIAGNGERGQPVDGQPAVRQPLIDPRAVAADSRGRVYILERGGHALRVVDPEGRIQTVAGTGQSGHRDGKALQAQFGSPKHICVDPQDRVYIADDQNSAIRCYDPRSGRVTTILGKGAGDPRIQLKNPHGVCWHNGWLYVVDTSHNRILRMKD